MLVSSFLGCCGWTYKLRDDMWCVNITELAKTAGLHNIGTCGPRHSYPSCPICLLTGWTATGYCFRFCRVCWFRGGHTVNAFSPGKVSARFHARFCPFILSPTSSCTFLCRLPNSQKDSRKKKKEGRKSHRLSDSDYPAPVPKPANDVYNCRGSFLTATFLSSLIIPVFWLLSS